MSLYVLGDLICYCILLCSQHGDGSGVFGSWLLDIGFRTGEMNETRCDSFLLESPGKKPLRRSHQCLDLGREK